MTAEERYNLLVKWFKPLTVLLSKLSTVEEAFDEYEKLWDFFYKGNSYKKQSNSVWNIEIDYFDISLSKNDEILRLPYAQITYEAQISIGRTEKRVVATCIFDNDGAVLMAEGEYDRQGNSHLFFIPSHEQERKEFAYGQAHQRSGHYSVYESIEPSVWAKDTGIVVDQFLAISLPILVELAEGQSAITVHKQFVESIRQAYLAEGINLSSIKENTLSPNQDRGSKP